MIKPHGCRDMSAEECALALQLNLDGANQVRIAEELRRNQGTVSKLIRYAGMKRGHRFRTKGPRAYLVARLMPVIHVPNPCDCQLPPGIIPDFAMVSTSCPFHGDDDGPTLWSTF